MQQKIQLAVIPSARPGGMESSRRKGLAPDYYVGACPDRQTASHFGGTCSKPFPCGRSRLNYREAIRAALVTTLVLRCSRSEPRRMATRSNPAPFCEPGQSIIVATYQCLFLIPAPAFDPPLRCYGFGNQIEVFSPNQLYGPAFYCPRGRIMPLLVFPHTGFNLFVSRRTNIVCVIGTL
jgi:hypothetical protein